MEIMNRRLGEANHCARVAGPRVRHRVVMDDNNAIRCRVDVELNGVGARREGTREGGQGILACVPRGAAVADHFGREMSPFAIVSH